MEIQLATERLFMLEEKLTVDEIHQRAMDRRTQAFSGGLGFLQRPKVEEVVLAAKQRRLEPFWHVSGSAHFVYERNRDYTVPVSAHDVQAITIAGTRYEATPPSGKSPGTVKLTALEHCREEFHHEVFTDALTSAPVADGATLIGGPRSEVGDPTSMSADGTVVLPPEHRASFVVRKLLSEVMKPMQADRLLEESIVLETTDLYYRPIWSYEFSWQAKGKQAVVEIDSVTGQTRQGKPLLRSIRGMVTRDLLFDLGADTAGLLVPGGSIAVKLAKAAIDKK